MKEISVRAGGQAGDGIASVGETVTRSLSRMGLHVFGLNAYQSVIRGGHVWFQARASKDRVHSQGDACDVLYALDHQTAEVHLPSLSSGGTVVFDPEKFAIPPEEVPVGTQALAVPTLEIARKYTSQSILQNAAGLGATAFLSGIPLDILQRTLADSFGKKKGEVVDWNLGASADGYAYARAHAAVNPNAVAPSGAPKLLLTGNQAIALGAAAAGCKFLAQYPMTPASTIMHWMAAHSQEIGVVVKQAEDELAAINMAIGASFGGVRAMTATSGGGFSLMVEALGMAGMTETPVVVVESQRSGPSTGLPTKTEQGDLNLMLGAGQGEFPRAILAPSNPAEAYRMTIRAFELAEAWQTPVLLASDFHLSECTSTVDREELDLDVEIPSLYAVEPNGHEYKRYLYTPTGVSPRAIPGQPGLNFIAGSDEHDEKGHLISDVKSGIPIWVAERTKMMNKRMSKLAGLAASTEGPVLEGPADAGVTFVAWGSTAGAVRDALRILAERGVAANLLFLPTIYPLHGAAVAAHLARAKRPVLVEANFSGQLGRLIRAETGVEIPNRLLKYDGEPFYPHEIVQKGIEVMGRGGQ
ncbi:MAG: 2-oxoacid:acceptor oxidoreductase subunit alpha [Thermoplasmata archaeon]|nr:2-oxoacid:acceptor oxidoreductase subunit alpha [Thermoplasmata archaeon]MCI4359210.1 2-oxoacid:acceptor oxidoreductase subunit alpha [Thermoplasmata archaeon]